ncbi:hypothetical protein DFAR_3560002 [Desulfarculales bacterium]
MFRALFFKAMEHCRAQGSLGRKKGKFKYMPSFVLLTEAKVADVTVAQGLARNPGSILILNRGYQDYALFGKWTGQGVFFVTCLKSNAVFEVMANRPGPKAQNVLADQTIFPTGSLIDCPYPLRRLVVWDDKNQKQVVLLTNHHKLTAFIVADIY